MRRRRLALIALVGVIALLAMACGEDTEGPGDTTEPATTEPATSEPATTEPGPTETEPTTPPPPEFTTIEEGVLTVGSCLDYPPFESVKEGEEIGFDVELTEEIAKRLGLEVTWVKANFDTIFTAVAAGRFDMVAAAATIKPGRAKIVDFSVPYYSSRQSLAVNTEETPDIKTVDDLESGDVVGAQKGSTGKDYAEAELEPRGIQIRTYQNAPQAFVDLQAGNIVGVINDEPASVEIIKNRPTLAVVQGIDTGEFYGFAFSQDNPGLTEAANQALQAMVEDGTYEQIFTKWFPGQEVQDPTAFES